MIKSVITEFSIAKTVLKRLNDLDKVINRNNKYLFCGVILIKTTKIIVIIAILPLIQIS